MNLIKSIGWFTTCDYCESQEGSHYCLLHGCIVKNMDTVRCEDYKTRKRNSKIKSPCRSKGLLGCMAISYN